MKTCSVVVVVLAVIAGGLWTYMKNGLKMTGMPFFGVTHDDDEIWGLVAFLRRLAALQPSGYRALVEKTGIDKEKGHRH